MGSRAYLLKIDVGEDFILFPYFERPLGNGDFDAASPWYYGGPIPSGSISREGFGTFLENLRRILSERGNISLFMRFHPYLKNHRNIIWRGISRRSFKRSSARNADGMLKRTGERE